MRLLVLGIFFFLSIGSLKSQAKPLKILENFITEEVYDSYLDSKGFLWFSHAQGVSRYDGSRYTHFNSSNSINPAFTDLTEDSYGTIWCHNFAGQIFFIKNEIMQLFNEYKYEEEDYFPRITVVNDLLIATSSKGIFTYDTRKKEIVQPDFKSKCTSTRFLTSCSRGVLLIGDKEDEIYLLEKSRKLIQLKLVNKTSHSLEINDLSLSPVFFKDTIYGYVNGKGLLCKSYIDGDNFIIDKIISENSFVNTISVSDGKIWVNTKQKSYAIGMHDTLYSHNLTDIIFDSSNNIWYTSLQHGILVNKREILEKSKICLKSKMVITLEVLKAMIYT